MTALPGRDAIVDAARLHAICDAIGAVHYVGCSVSEWTGDRSAGSYYYDPLSGDRLALRWTASRLVAAVFAHESERSQYNDDDDDLEPLRWLGSSDPGLRELAAVAAEELEDLVTAALWVEPGRPAEASDPIDPATVRWAHGLDLLAGFLVPAEQALFGPMFQTWGELLSLTEDQCRVALRLARCDGPAAVTDVESRLLLVNERPPTAGGIADGVAKLAALGVEWRP